MIEIKATIVGCKAFKNIKMQEKKNASIKQQDKYKEPKNKLKEYQQLIVQE